RSAERCAGGESRVLCARPRMGSLLRVEGGFELGGAAGEERAQNDDGRATDGRSDRRMRARGCLRRLSSTELSEREIRVQTYRVDSWRRRRCCQVGRQLVPTDRRADLPELDGGECRIPVGSQCGSRCRISRMGFVDTAARGKQRGRAEDEGASEHGASLNGMVDRPPKNAFHESMPACETARESPPP